ncbi:MAG: hypothetical protein A2Y79_06915 [Deltaproteobacteria bacterium RBG_13_43_22]|nr:MAG: hypothetical protein A2Y79_06915 [Deltaproteobacteria bacterium RBG_13_43_22]
MQVFIVGFGKFGKLALDQVVQRWGKARIWMIDSRSEVFINQETLPEGIRVLADGPQFLSEYQTWIRDEDWVIPTLPIHLAWSWLNLNLKTPQRPKSVWPPPDLGVDLPFRQIHRKGLFLSYADFVCPENCPAPIRFCFKTKAERAVPLWKFIADQPFSKGTLAVIESRQIAPGIGGYAFKELRKIQNLAQEASPPFFVATACRCHGVIHGLTW